MNCKRLENVFHVVGNFVLGILYVCECIYLVYVCLQFTLTLESVMCVLFIFSLPPNMNGTLVQVLYWDVVKLWVIHFNSLHLCH
jgi:hypothetical protein